MGKIRKTTPEENARQDANQRRLEQLIERRLAEEQDAARQPPKPPVHGR